MASDFFSNNKFAILILEKCSKDKIRIIIQQIFKITTLRTKRFFISKEHSHKSVFFLIFLMASVITLGLILMSIKSLYLHIFMVDTIYISMATLTMILHDLSNPFKGIWKINLEGYHYFLKNLKK